MAYTKTNWVNNGTPPLSAANLNNIENGIYNCDNAINSMATYSTSEIPVGTWIDGKTIYRKVVDVGTMPNTGTTKTVSAGLVNFGYMVKIYGIAKSSSGAFAPLPDTYPASNNNVYAIRILYTSNDDMINIQTATDRSSYSGYVILEYVKTS